MKLIRCSHKKARRTERFFSMIEVAMALAVVAIGVVSIVALFPIGMEASRDAIADSYAADAADGFLHYQATLGKTSGNWANLTGLSPSKPDSGQTGIETTFSSSATSITGTNTKFYASSTPGLFKIAMEPDFSGVFRLWRSDVTYGGSLTIPNTVAVGLNVEVSWPSQAPYPKRKRALYYLEVFNPN